MVNTSKLYALLRSIAYPHEPCANAWSESDILCAQQQGYIKLSSEKPFHILPTQIAEEEEKEKTPAPIWEFTDFGRRQWAKMSVPSLRYDRDKIYQDLREIKQMIERWNRIAEFKRWPIIAVSMVWGSVARSPDQQTFGDIDLAIVWARPNAETPPSLKPLSLVDQAWAQSLEQQWEKPSMGDIEDWCESKLFSSWATCQISGVDQWHDLQQDPIPFVARPLNISESYGPLSKVVKSYEWDVISDWIHQPPFEVKKNSATLR